MPYVKVSYCPPRVGTRLVWWLSAKLGETKLSRQLVFMIWDALNNWLDRAVPVFRAAGADFIHIDRLNHSPFR